MKRAFCQRKARRAAHGSITIYVPFVGVAPPTKGLCDAVPERRAAGGLSPVGTGSERIPTRRASITPHHAPHRRTKEP